MENISAACAMEWSIELEKGLRSKKPGQPMEAILRIGPRLEQWNREPRLTIIEYNLFHLIRGEDRLFANTIFLRLVDAFRLGDEDTRRCVLRVFLLLMRQHDCCCVHNNGIFSVYGMSNQKELVKRIKTMFFTEDIKLRALTLILFGCWAHFVVDNAEIRYLILSCLASHHDLEVRASLYAAGCFSKLADDFASVVLGILVNIMTLSKASLSVRLAGVRAYAKLGCSISLANKVYKIGVRLVQEFTEEDLVGPMLISLSKLASKSTVLISEQVDLLFMFLTRKTALHLKEIALKCLHFLCGVGASSLSSICSIQTLFNMLGQPELPSALQYEALKMLHKIFSLSLPSLPEMNTLDFSKLLTIFENVNVYSLISMRVSALHLLIAISDRYGVAETGTDRACSTVPFQIISLAFDRIILLLKVVLDPPENDSKVEEEIKSLLKVLLLCAKRYPDLGVLIMNKISLLMESLVNIFDKVSDTGKLSLSIHVFEEFEKGKGPIILLKLLFYVYKFMMACFENLSEGHALSAEVLHRAKHLSEHVCHCSLFDCYTRAIYSLLLHYLITCECLIDSEKINCFFVGGSGFCIHDYMAEQEITTLDCAKELLEARLNWSAYRAGTFAASLGAWFTAAFIFGKLMKNVESEACCYWLKSLVLFAYSELELKLLLLNTTSLVASLEANKVFLMPSGVQVGAWSINPLKCSEKLSGLCCMLGSSMETLGRASDERFCFQRWFLSLRAKILGSVVDILKFLDALPFDLNKVRNKEQVDGSIIVKHFHLSQESSSWVYHLNGMSFQLRRLAREFDLIAASFIDMDRKSAKIISALALGCSVLAFCTGFTLYSTIIPSFSDSTVCGLEKLESCSLSMLVQDLVDRLPDEMSVNLRLILKLSGQPSRCSRMHFRNQALSIGREMSDVVRVCSYAVQEFANLQNEAKKVHDKETLLHATQGFKVLLNVIEKWMHIPFQVPKYFFQVRPCVGSELFAFSKDRKGQDGISVLPGFQLSLDLCLQMKNMRPDILRQQAKLYCILYCRTSFQVTGSHVEDKGHLSRDFQRWETNSMVDLNDKLSHYIVGCSEGFCVEGDDADATAFVCFKLNGRGQGFSTCLLDVSAFPIGSYRIKWHSCFIDNQGLCWSLLPLNDGPVFTVQNIPFS